MKYERLTDRDDDGMPYVKCADCYIRDKCDLTEEVCYQELQDRLAELEDKIERGELVEAPKGAVVLTPEERAEEMRLANEERKQAVIEFAVRLKKKADSYNYDENYINRSVIYTDIDDLVTEVCGE